MARPSGREQRIAALAELCGEGAIIHITEAARQLGTSEITIRRDLASGNERLACLGGYVMRASEGAHGYSVSVAQSEEAEAKMALAMRAATLIEPGDTLFIDCGTTTPHLAARLPQDQNITVVTQSLNVAEAVTRLSGVTLVLLAGLYHHKTGSFTSPEAVTMLERINITKGFFSAAGVHESQGVTCFNFYEVDVKRAALARCERRYLLCAGSKLGKLRPATYAQIGAFDLWIGDPRPVAAEAS